MDDRRKQEAGLAPRRRAMRALRALETGRGERLAGVLDLDGLAAADRRLARELAHGVERQRLLLDFALEQLAHRGLPRDPNALAVLRLGAYQLLFLDRIPPHAAVHATLALLPAPRRGFPNALLRRLGGMIAGRAADPSRPRHELALPATPPRALVFDDAVLPDPQRRPAAALALQHALPEFLVAGWVAEHGHAAATAAAAASAAVPGVVLRAMRRRGGRDVLAARLAADGVIATALAHPDLLAWSGGASPFDSTAFADGLFVVQDPTAVAALDAVEATAGETVLDLCAAPGTKTSGLADRVGPSGRVFAHDADRRRLQRLRDDVLRLGLGETVGIVDDLDAVPPVDAVLADVPCSNTGVLARRVEVRRRLRPDTAATLAVTQRALLADALRRVRAGGRVVYATCSIEGVENRGVVDAVLAADGGARLLRDRLILPATPEHDGGYHAVLERRA